MKNQIAQAAFLLILCIFSININGQIYLEAVGGIKEIDLCNCQVTDVAAEGSTSLAAGANMNPIYSNGDEVYEYNLNSGASTLIGSMPGGNNMVCAANGLIYQVSINIDGISFLSVLNPATGVFTDLGLLPAGLYSGGDLFFYDGALYLLGFTDLVSGFFEIPLANPGATTLSPVLTDFAFGVGAASFFIDGVETVFVSGNGNGSGEEGIYEYNMETGEYEFVCPFSTVFDMGVWSGLQVSGCCENFAGNFQNLNLVQACENENITLNHLGDEVLNAGSALSYVLVADSLANLPAGILQISASPTFNFNDVTLNTNTVYFVAAIAAAGPPGAPNWSADCFDKSFFAKIEWKPAPSVTLVGSLPEFCGADCANFPLQFSGNLPINLSWEINFGGTNLNGILMADTPTEALTVCPPTGQSFPQGNFSLQFLTISNSFCTCP